MSESELTLGAMPGRECATRRFVEALVRTLGPTQVTIRVADPSTGDTGSQLGLEPPPSEDLQIFPAIVNALPPSADGSKRLEILVSETTLAPVAKSHNVRDVATWLLTAQGVLHHDELLHIDTVIADRALSSICLYRITATE